jgi:O-antigen/teichoic acid export membrane protein
MIVGHATTGGHVTGIRRVLAIVTTANYFGLVVRFALLTAVSRLMTPHEIGVSVIGTGSVTMAFALRDFATSDFLIQRKDLAREDVRTAFTLLFGITAFITIVILILAPRIATDYGEGGLARFLYVLAAAGLLESFALPITARLRREMAFGILSVMDATGVVVGAVVTLGLAALGFSYMSFAWAWFCSSAITAALALYFRPHLWVYRPSLRSWRAVLSFGGCNGLTSMLERAYEALPQLLLGRFLPLSAVGLYNRAGAICGIGERLILSQIVSVALPAFAARAREGQGVKAAYLRAISYITVLHWPAQVVLALLAHPIVMVVLGRQWAGIVPLVQVMCLSGLFWSPGTLTHRVLIALGAYRHNLMASLIARPVAAFVLCVASFHGIMGLAASQFLTWPFQMFVVLFFLRRHVSLQWSELAAEVGKSTLVVACTAAGPAAVMVLAGFRSDLKLGPALIAGFLSVGCWMGGLWLAHHPFMFEIRNLLGMLERSLFAQQLLGIGQRLRHR